MKILLLLMALLPSSIFASDISRATWELANQVVLSRGTAETFLQLERAAVSSATIAPMDFTLLSQGTKEAFIKLSEMTKNIAADNPKATAAVVGAGTLGYFVYQGVNYLSTIDPKKAGSTALMGYGALRMLGDAKNALKSMLCAVEQEEKNVRAEIIMDEFHNMQSNADSILENMNKDTMTPEKKSFIFLQLKDNRLRMNNFFKETDEN